MLSGCRTQAQRYTGIKKDDMGKKGHPAAPVHTKGQAQVEAGPRQSKLGGPDLGSNVGSDGSGPGAH